MQDHEARASDLNRKLIFSFFLIKAYTESMNGCLYLYTALITYSYISCLRAVYKSIESDRMSACEGASGYRYQFHIFSYTHPTHA